MMRLIVLSLLLLNGVYLAWGQSWLLPYGWGPLTQREPQRLAQQVQPQTLVLVERGDVGIRASAPASAASASAPVASAATPASAALASASAASAASTASTASDAPVALCLQSVPLEATLADALRTALQRALTSTAWTLEALPAPQRWIIYMGKFQSDADVLRKRTQLAHLGLKFYPLGDAALSPGLSLGGYPAQEQANAALDALKQRGVRTARVIDATPATTATVAYRLQAQGSQAVLQKLQAELKTLLPNKPLQPCAATTAP